MEKTVNIPKRSLGVLGAKLSKDYDNTYYFIVQPECIEYRDSLGTYFKIKAERQFKISLELDTPIEIYLYGINDITHFIADKIYFME
jgi:hypothetical protein